MKSFAMAWLECLEEKFPGWLYQTVCSSGTNALWIMDYDNDGKPYQNQPVAWCPEPPESNHGDFIHPACFGGMVEDFYEGEVDICQMTAIICDDRCFKFTLDEVPVYRNLPSPLR